MKLKVNDKVMVISGKNRGKTGKILKIDREKNRVVVEKVNLQTKFKKKKDSTPGSRTQKEGFISASNVMVLDPKTGKPTRIGYQIQKDGTKIRFCKKSGTPL